MSGALTTHPYVKTYDELQRSITRMTTFRDTYKKEFAKEEQETLEELIFGLNDAIDLIPEAYRVTRYKRAKEGK